MEKGKLYIGTSGWMYKDWGKAFYPGDMKKGFLTYLANEFNTVEVNASFYRLPALKTFEKWREETPDDFIFTIKLSRYITHIKRLKETREALERFLNNAVGLEKKLGMVLIQLPPNIKFEPERLANFFSELEELTLSLPFKPRYALEPRNAGFIENRKELIKILIPYSIGLVFPNSASIPSFLPEEENIIADFIYARFHGPAEFAASRYGKELLMPWAEKMVKWINRGLDVFAYFNNDTHGHAVYDARDLKECYQAVEEMSYRR